MLTHTVCRVLGCVEQTVSSSPDKLINDLCSLDTGRLNPETYRLFDTVEKHYGIRIEYTFPDAQETMDLVREKGMFSFYEDGHQECCRVRKVLCICPTSLCMHLALQQSNAARCRLALLYGVHASWD